MDEYDLDLEGFDDEVAAEEDELNDAQDEDMTSGLGSAELSEGEGQLPDMDAKEMKAKSFYKVEAILRSKYRHGWRFLVKWEGYSMAEATWEPYTAFIVDQGEFGILGLLPRQRIAESAQTSGDQEYEGARNALQVRT